MDKIWFEMPDGTKKDVESLAKEINEKVEKENEINAKRSSTTNSGEVQQLESPSDEPGREADVSKDSTS